MRAIRDLYFISADKDSNKTLGVNGIDGNPLFIDIDFNKYHHAVQSGTIESCPGRISPSLSNDIPLVKGDKVYFHHFIVQKDNLYLNEGREYYKCDYRDMYCVIRDEQIRMLEDWILCVPVLEPEDNFFRAGLYLKPTREHLPLRAKVTHLSKKATEAGLNVGDEIIYRADADYEMPIEGNKYYRMKYQNVVAIIKDGPSPTKDNVIVKTYNNDQEQIGSILVVRTKKVRQQKAKVISGDEEVTNGSDIIYFLGSATDFQYNGETFTLLKKDSVVAELA